MHSVMDESRMVRRPLGSLKTPPPNALNASVVFTTHPRTWLSSSSSVACGSITAQPPPAAAA